MATVNEKMTAIADEIRELSGVTGPMGLDAMASNLGEVNVEVKSQVDLIAQIQTALQGKTAGGVSAEFITGTVSIDDSADWLDMDRWIEYMTENFTWTAEEVPTPDQGALEITTLKDGIIFYHDKVTSIVNGTVSYANATNVIMVHDSGFDIKFSD